MLNFCEAIDRRLPQDLYECNDVDEVLNQIVEAINGATEALATKKIIKKRATGPLYLTYETRQAMAARDAAAKCRCPSYRTLRNTTIPHNIRRKEKPLNKLPFLFNRLSNTLGSQFSNTLG